MISTVLIAPQNSGYNANFYTNTPSFTDDQVINQAINELASLGSYTKLKLVPGATYTLTKPIVAQAKILLDCRGATINLAANSNCNMLIDQAHYSGSGSVDHISIWGGIWDRGANAGSGQNLMSMILGGSKLDCRDLEFKSTNGKYAMLIHNATDFYINNIFMNDIHSDGVHIDGPAARGTVKNIYGQSGDDLVSITPMDWTAYAFSSGGDVTDITIDTIIPNSCTANAVRILGGTNGATVYNTKRIKVRNISGSMTSVAQSVVYIGDDTTQANTSNGQVDDIQVEGVGTITASVTNTPLIEIKGSSTSLTIPNIKINGVTLLGDAYAIVRNDNAKITNLEVSNVSGATSANPLNAIAYNNNTAASIENLHLNNISVKNAGSAGGQLVKEQSASGVLNHVFANNIKIDNFAQLMDTIHTTTTYVFLSNVRVIGNSNILNVRSGSPVVIQACNGIYADTTSSSITSTGTVESKSYNFPLDVGNAQIVKNTGDMAYNTNAARSCGVGPVGYNGVAWYNAMSGATF